MKINRQVPIEPRKMNGNEDLLLGNEGDMEKRGGNNSNKESTITSRVVNVNCEKKKTTPTTTTTTPLVGQGKIEQGLMTKQKMSKDKTFCCKNLSCSKLGASCNKVDAIEGSLLRALLTEKKSSLPDWSMTWNSLQQQQQQQQQQPQKQQQQQPQKQQQQEQKQTVTENFNSEDSNQTEVCLDLIWYQ